MEKKNFKNSKNIWEFLKIVWRFIDFHLLYNLPYAQYVPKKSYLQEYGSD